MVPPEREGGDGAAVLPLGGLHRLCEGAREADAAADLRKESPTKLFKN